MRYLLYLVVMGAVVHNHGASYLRNTVPLAGDHPIPAGQDPH